MTSAEALQSARALIVKPGVWGKGRYKRSLPGCRAQYCAVGAIYEVTGQNFDACFDAERLLDSVCKKRHDVGILCFNDNQTSVEPVLTLFDAAIKAAKPKRRKAPARPAKRKTKKAKK